MIFLLAVFALLFPNLPVSADACAVPNAGSLSVEGHLWFDVSATLPIGFASVVGWNDFGRACNATPSWSALCALDSDGDGFTNGEELGDPDCVWVVGAAPNRTANLSHPGLYASVPVDAYPGRARAAAVCTRGGASQWREDRRVSQRSAAMTTPFVELLKTFNTTVDVRKADADSHLPPAYRSQCPYNDTGLSDWHDPGTWGGSTPAAGSSVTLPTGKRVLVSTCSFDPRGYAKIVIPAGTALVFADEPIFLRVKEISVQGELLVGSAACPLHGPISITFMGEKQEVGTYSNGVMVTGTGAMRLHGIRNEWTWTRLAATIVPGTAFVFVQDAVGWGPGDEIVVATSVWRDDLTDQNEVRRVSAVSLDGKTLLVDQPFRFKHFASVEYQTEVGLLSRSAHLRGSPSEEATRDRFGGHTMSVGAGAVTEVVGVRAERMGQQNVLGRYPFHMHLSGESGPLSTLEQAACVHCWYRCVSVHKTNRTTVRKNVAYNTSGHTFYLEDGGEMFNTIAYNFAVRVHVIGRPARGAGQKGETIEEDDDAIQPADHTASGFYVPNPHNYVIGNAASGGWSGFSYPVFPYTMRLSADLGLNPSTYPVLEFDGNTAHSSSSYWGDAGCIYYGGLLTDNTTTQRFSYSNGRFAHPTRAGEVHKITNTRVWLCSRGFSSWGSRVDIYRFEAHETLRGAVLFGQSSMRAALVTGATGNDPPDMRYNGRQGFGFYDTSVMTILSNMTFRSFWRRKDSYEIDGVIADLTFSDVFKPWGISAIRDFALENVDSDRIVARWVRESSSSRMFNVMDWDGSLVESPTCQAHIIGSDIDWWNGGSDCYYRADWPAWVCPRKPGREVVGLEIDLGNMTSQAFADERTDSVTNLLTQAQRDKLYIGHMSQWGAASNRKLTLTRNAHLATGLSGIGWYLYLNEGVPPLIRIYPINFPTNGVYIGLAIPYPSGTTFDIRSMTSYGSHQTLYLPVATPDDVMRSNGSTYAFQDGLLYLKIGDWWTPYPNAYTRDNTIIFGVMYNRRYVVVNASCPQQTAAGYCAPPAAPNPPPMDGLLPARACHNISELTTPQIPKDLCPTIDDTLRPDLVAAYGTCDAYVGPSMSKCWGLVNIGYCNATCNGRCRVFNPYPPRCTYQPPCLTSEKRRPPREGQCGMLTSNPTTLAKEECTIKTCSGGRLNQFRAPADTPCGAEVNVGEGSAFRCLPTGVCANASFYAPSGPIARRVSDRRHEAFSHWLEVLVAARGHTIANVTAVMDGSGYTGVSTVALLAPFPTAPPPPGSSESLVLFRYCHPHTIRRNVTVVITTSAPGQQQFAFPFYDWGGTAQLVPKVVLTSTGIRVDPIDWVQRAQFFSSGATAASDVVARNENVTVTDLVCDYGNRSSCDAFSLATTPAPTMAGAQSHPFAATAAMDAFVLLTMVNGVTIRRPLPCLAPERHRDQPCRVGTAPVTVRPPYTNCSFALYYSRGNRFWYEIANADNGGNLSGIAAITAPGDKRLSKSATLFFGSANGQMTPAVLIVTLAADGRNETYLYKQAGTEVNVMRPLQCLSGYGPPPPLPEQPAPVSGEEASDDYFCADIGTCVFGPAPPPPTTTTTTTIAAITTTATATGAVTSTTGTTITAATAAVTETGTTAGGAPTTAATSTATSTVGGAVSTTESPTTTTTAAAATSATANTTTTATATATAAATATTAAGGGALAANATTAVTTAGNNQSAAGSSSASAAAGETSIVAAAAAGGGGLVLLLLLFGLVAFYVVVYRRRHQSVTNKGMENVAPTIVDVPKQFSHASAMHQSTHQRHHPLGSENLLHAHAYIQQQFTHESPAIVLSESDGINPDDDDDVVMKYNDEGEGEGKGEGSDHAPLPAGYEHPSAVPTHDATSRRIISEFNRHK